MIQEAVAVVTDVGVVPTAGFLLDNRHLVISDVRVARTRLIVKKDWQFVVDDVGGAVVRLLDNRHIVSAVVAVAPTRLLKEWQFVVDDVDGA